MIELLIIFGSIVLIMVCVTMIVRWGIELEQEKFRHKNGANSLTSRELQALIHEAVETATAPLLDRIEQLEDRQVEAGRPVSLLDDAPPSREPESLNEASYFARRTPA